MVLSQFFYFNFSNSLFFFLCLIFDFQKNPYCMSKNSQDIGLNSGNSIYFGISGKIAHSISKKLLPFTKKSRLRTSIKTKRMLGWAVFVLTVPMLH